ncbi:integrase [Elizabethkingia anophelis]|nr:integrase [Elizabethkingia anophelis]
MLKFSVNISVRNKGALQELVRIRVLYNSIDVELYSGVYASFAEWDKVAKRISAKKDPRNKSLTEIETIIDDIFKEYDVIEKRFPTREELKSAYAKKSGKSKKPRDTPKDTFVDIIQMHSDEVGNKDSWSTANYKRFNKLKNHIYYYNKNLLIKNLNEDDLIGLIKYFQGKPKKILRTGNVIDGPPHKNTTTARTIKDVRAVLRWAAQKGYYTGNLHETFYPKFKGANFDINKPVFFTWEQLMTFYNHEFNEDEKHLEDTRDVVAFCCFTSLRHSDVFALKKSNVSSDSIEITTQKDTDTVKIELNKYSKAILEKHKDIFGDKPLPVKSLDKTNDQLKQIGHMLGFNEVVNYTYFVGDKRFDEEIDFSDDMSSHIGRRTFIVNSLHLGIPAEVIMKWTGHTDYQTMKPYIAIVDDLKKTEMDKFNNK